MYGPCGSAALVVLLKISAVGGPGDGVNALVSPSIWYAYTLSVSVTYKNLPLPSTSIEVGELFEPRLSGVVTLVAVPFAGEIGALSTNPAGAPQPSKKNRPCGSTAMLTSGRPLPALPGAASSWPIV